MSEIDGFHIDPRLLQGKIHLHHLPMCQVLLVDDCHYPAWLLAVPRLNQITELTQLSHDEQHRLWQELGILAAIVKKICEPCKLNIASLGNIVPQLHIHITARRPDDPAWPGPCYGAVPAKPWNAADLDQLKQKFCHEIKVMDIASREVAR
ncbi:MAG: HIT domain-containing protein [Oligoflexus sp.]